MAANSEALRTDLDVCPSCGDFAELDDVSGWCSSCTGISADICSRCGKEFTNDSYRQYCSRCRHLIWLEENADEIEYWLEQGLCLKSALKEVKVRSRTRCLSCHQVLQGPGLFCHAPKCRKVYWKYVVRRRKGIAKERAIREALAA